MQIAKIKYSTLTKSSESPTISLESKKLKKESEAVVDTENEPLSRVQRGFQFLTELHNNDPARWAMLVSTDTLRMESPLECPLGQLFGSFNLALETIEGLNWATAHTLGFYGRSQVEREALAQAWTELIHQVCKPILTEAHEMNQTLGKSIETVDEFATEPALA